MKKNGVRENEEYVRSIYTLCHGTNHKESNYNLYPNS